MIEVMIALSILLVAVLALASLQVVEVKSNRASDRTLQASGLGNDLVENIRRWSYTDSRLTAFEVDTSTNAASIVTKWDMGKNSTASYVAQFTDNNVADANATTNNALGATYQGLSGDVDADGTFDLIRYWNVYAISLDGSSVENGKLIQIIIRWRESGFGWRQITTSTFVMNPAIVTQ